MIRPRTHCPFRSDETGINFASPARAPEIALRAFLDGLPCHTTAAAYAELDMESGPSAHVFGHGMP